MASIPSPIRKWIEQFVSERGFLQSSSDVDHDATSNRTHDGDDIEPDSVTTEALEAEDILTDPSGTEHTGELADSADLHARYTDEEAEDAVAAILQGGDKVSVSYDDANETLDVDTSALDTEEVEDAVASLVAADSNLSWSYDDSGDTLTISLADSISVGTLEATTTQSELVATPRVNRTLSSNDLDVSDASYILVSGEGGSADTLQTISGAVEGQKFVLQANNDITIEEANGIALSSRPYTLNNPIDTITFIADGNGNYIELSRSDNA